MKIPKEATFPSFPGTTWKTSALKGRGKKARASAARRAAGCPGPGALRGGPPRKQLTRCFVGKARRRVFLVLGQVSTVPAAIPKNHPGIQQVGTSMCTGTTQQNPYGTVSSLAQGKFGYQLWSTFASFLVHHVGQWQCHWLLIGFPSILPTFARETVGFCGHLRSERKPSQASMLPKLASTPSLAVWIGSGGSGALNPQSPPIQATV